MIEAISKSSVKQVVKSQNDSREVHAPCCSLMNGCAGSPKHPGCCGFCWAQQPGCDGS